MASLSFLGQPAGLGIITVGGGSCGVMVSAVEERDLCYGVKRANASRSGTSQNPQTPTPNQHQSQKHKTHVL